MVRCIISSPIAYHYHAPFDTQFFMMPSAIWSTDSFPATSALLPIADVQLQQVRVSPETTSIIDFVLTKMNLDIYGDGDMDRETIQVINHLRGSDTTLCPDCDLDEDGTITGLDARKAMVQCTRPGCAVE